MVLFTFILILTLTEISLAEQRMTINCRKYVFAPKCRGVAAKRDLQTRAERLKLLGPKFPWDFTERQLPKVKAYF